MTRRRILLVAFHFPPLLGSSGWLRTAAFARHLPEHGWEPVVLSASPRAYSATSSASLAAVEGVETCRAFALDTSRQLSIRGRYPLALALPDRWVSWFPAAVARGLGILRRCRPSAIWATFPVPTAIAIGLALRRLSGLPLVVDLRDAMVDPDFPETASERWAYRWLERHAVSAAAAVVLTTPGAATLYRERYPELSAERFHIIPNGYDEEVFKKVEQRIARQPRDNATEIRLLHSGLLSRVDRNPQAFFEALGKLKQSGTLRASALRIVLRGSGDEHHYQQQIDSLGISDLVELAPSVDYETALEEMLLADGLLLFQGATCNHAIPAKVFEYFRARRPVLALTDPGGDTAALLQDAGVGELANLSDAGEIEQHLPAFIESLRSGRAAIASDETIERYSRSGLTGDLAQLLDSLVTGHAGR